ncbi:DUF7159 family protein [Mycobacterium nebraskense]|nr:hypothetical protein [Mycobacterium nebraskense]
MAPTAVQMVLIEGENADGVTVDQDNFEIRANGDSTPSAGADRVISAILGTREGAAEGGYQLLSTGVTYSDPLDAAALREALANRKIENVMLVSAFLAAAALAQTVGNATGYAHTALLFVQPDTATLAVVDTADGSIADVHRRPLPEDDDEAMAELVRLVSGAQGLNTHPDGVFVIGSGVDVPLIKPALETATSLPVNAPEEPEAALARGAALASANAPLFASSTAALAYAQDPDTGALDPYAIAPAYIPAAGTTGLGEGDVAYSAVADDKPDAYPAGGDKDFLTGAFADISAGRHEQARKSFWLPGSALIAVFVVGVVALVIALATSVRPTVDQQPGPGQNLVTPTKPAPPMPATPTPPPAASAPVAPAPTPAAPAPEAPEVSAPTPAAPAPEASAPVPAPVPVAPIPTRAPVAPIPTRAPVAPVPAPVPVAPVPVAPPAPPPPPAPPIVIPLPPIFGPPGHGGGGHGGGGHGGEGHGGEGHGGGGFGIPGIPGLPGFMH